MQNVRQKTVAVLFGGRSAEHEVSVITGHQIMDALKVSGHPILPIYVTKEGAWFAGAGVHNIKQYSCAHFALDKIPGVQRVGLSPYRTVGELWPVKSDGSKLFGKPQPMGADHLCPAMTGPMR